MQPMNRRTFIGSSLAATLSAAARPAWAADSARFFKSNPPEAVHQIDRIGLQLYTVRDAMKTDFEDTIAKVAATGYKEVEFGLFRAFAARRSRASRQKRPRLSFRPRRLSHGR